MTLCRVWMYGYPGFSGMGGMLFHTLFWIGIVLLFAAVVVYFLQKNKTTPTTLSHDMYMDELKQMFVRGEISDVEFMHRRDVLNGNV
ncbi:MAG: SHOCT domain-containing protein, partial [Erysipelotrichaceae bacterium]